MVRELLSNGRTAYKMLGFIDDDPGKHRARVQGYPVLGGYDSLVSLIAGGAVDAVVVSARLIDLGRLSDLETLCAEHGVTLSRLQFDLEELIVNS